MLGQLEKEKEQQKVGREKQQDNSREKTASSTRSIEDSKNTF